MQRQGKLKPAFSKALYAVLHNRLFQRAEKSETNYQPYLVQPTELLHCEMGSVFGYFQEIVHTFCIFSYSEYGVLIVLIYLHTLFTLHIYIFIWIFVLSYR